MRKFLSVALIFFILFGACGCASLRKKFVRKRRKDAAPPLYLELKDYPHVPTQDMYHQYWLFVRGWLDELRLSIEEDSNKKRQLKAADEALMNFEQIVYFFNEQGKEIIAPLKQELVSIRETVHDPYFSSSMNTTIIVRRISKAKREFERDYTYDKASIWLGQE